MPDAALARIPRAPPREGVAARATLTEMARWACAVLNAGRPPDQATARSASWARQMAALTLFLEHRLAAPREKALAIAAREIALRWALTPGSVKKNRSEARAILDFGWDGAPPKPHSAVQPNDLLHDLVAGIAVIRLADIRRRRAAALHGARGGRPAAAQMRILALVRRLRAEADTDPACAQEVEAIRMELAG